MSANLCQVNMNVNNFILARKLVEILRQFTEFVWCMSEDDLINNLSIKLSPFSVHLAGGSTSECVLHPCFPLPKLQSLIKEFGAHNFVRLSTELNKSPKSDFL